MCQQICLQILGKNKKWLTAREIQKQAKNISIGSVMNNLKKLSKDELIETKKSKKLTRTDVPIPVKKYRAKR